MRNTVRLIFAFLLFSLAASAQWRWSPYAWQYQSVKNDSLLVLPKLLVNPSLLEPGAIRWNISTARLQVYNGAQWVDQTPASDLSLYYTKTQTDVGFIQNQSASDQNAGFRIGLSGQVFSLKTNAGTIALGRSHFQLLSNNLVRWAMGLYGVEAGSNSGADWYLARIADDGLGALGSVIYAKRANGFVGIATNVPDAQLHVNGTFKISDGSQANGRVLQSDANGLASWKDLPAVTPEMFGAVGDGVTNDAAALQAACNSGRPVVIPGKTYLINTSVNVPAATTITGAGNKSILATTGNIAVLNINGDSVYISGIKFVGDGKGATLNAGKSGQYGIKGVDNKTRNVITGCRFDNLGGAGIFLKNNGFFRGNQISDCYAENSNVGFALDTSAEYTVMTNVIAKDNHYGVLMRGGNNSIIGGTLIANDIGLRMEYGTNNGHSVISGVSINHNTVRAVSADSITIGYTFTGCMFYASSIQLDDCTGFKFVGCDLSVDSVISNNSKACLFSNNRCRGVDPVLSFDATSQVYWRDNINEITGNAAPETITVSANTALNAGNKNVWVATPSAVTLTLPPVANCTGKYVTIKKASNNTNAVIIDPNGSETVEGQTTLSITTYLGYYQLYSNGTSWLVIGAGGGHEYSAFITVSVSTTLDRSYHTVRTTTSGITLTFPAASGFPGGEYEVLNHSAGTVTISPSYTNTAGTTGNTTLAATSTAIFRSDGSAWYQIK